MAQPAPLEAHPLARGRHVAPGCAWVAFLTSMPRCAPGRHGVNDGRSSGHMCQVHLLCVALSSCPRLFHPPLAVTHELHKAGMLPAIWFIFSRRDCDLAARQLALHGVQLTSDEGRPGGGRQG